jgi:hypothetical protein
MRGRVLLTHLQVKYRRILCQEILKALSVESWVLRQSGPRSCTYWFPRRLCVSNLCGKITFYQHFLSGTRALIPALRWGRDCRKIGDENGDCLLYSLRPCCCSQFWVRVCSILWIPKSSGATARLTKPEANLPQQREEQENGRCR